MKKITLLLILITTYFGYAQPSNNAVAPIARNASDVKAVYGTNTGSYTNIAGINYNPNWGQSGTVSTTFNPGTGDLLLKYANFNYQGTDWAGTPQNLSSMEYLHVDLWTAANPAATTIQVSPVNSTGTTEFLVTIPYTTGTWKSIDIPKSAFTGMTWSSVIQLKFAANGAGSTVPVDIYLDNIYFWKAPAATGTDATLSDIKVNGTTLAGFSSGTTTYTYELAIGTTIVPQITSTTKTDPTATVTSITQATSIPGTATVVVKSQNTLVTKTYTISFVATLPNASPTPKNYSTHLALLSDITDTSSFTNFWNPTYYFGANDGVPDLDPTVGVNKAIKMFLNTGWGGGIDNAGVDVTTNVSTSDMVHIDYFVPSSVAPGVNGHQFYLDLISRTGGANTETFYGIGTTLGGTASGSIDKVIVLNSWQSLDIPLATFVGKGFNPATFFQFKLGSESDIRTKLVYFDNIFFYKASTFLGVADFETSKVKLYPNPVKTELNIDANSEIQKVSVYNLLGQEVLTKSPKSNSTKLQTNTLQKGAYIVKTTINGKVSSSKIVKE